MKHSGDTGVTSRLGSPLFGHLVPSNMTATRAVESISLPQRHRFWSKEVAALNMLRKSVTDDTSQLDKSWLNELAERNMPLMSVTEDVDQAETSPLKAESRNISAMLVTEDVSQLLTSWLNPELCIIARWCTIQRSIGEKLNQSRSETRNTMHFVLPGTYHIVNITSVPG